MDFINWLLTTTPDAAINSLLDSILNHFAKNPKTWGFFITVAIWFTFKTKTKKDDWLLKWFLEKVLRIKPAIGADSTKQTKGGEQ